jgi:hypothetical protein
MKVLTEKRLRDLMGQGYPLIRSHTQRGPVYYVPPYGTVDNQIAEKMVNHALVGGQGDGFWPGFDQTYRMITG